MDEDISKLMDGRYEANLPHGRDAFAGSDEVSKRASCLLLETVTGGRSRSDRSGLLSLPAEILSSIIDILSENDKSDLASLALVSSDCQQLARSGQFSDILFDYSVSAQNLALHLGRDAAERRQTQGVESTSIGSCVRRLTFASSPDYVAEHHVELFHSVWGGFTGQDTESSEGEIDELKRKAYENYRNVQQSTLLAISRIMPNLEVLKWSDDFAIDEHFFNYISRSSAQHVILDCLVLKVPIRLGYPTTPIAWPLRKLDLDVKLAGNLRDEGLADSAFYETLLRLCAPTLESLKFNERRSNISDMIFFKDQDPPSFPRLRSLRLRALDPPPSFISLFLKSPLKSLELPNEIRNTSSMAAMAGDGFRDLESLVVPCLPFKDAMSREIASFIRQHTQIRKLSVHENNYAKGNRAHLDRHIIPVLAHGGFQHLTSLSLQWGGAGIDESEMDAVFVPDTSLAVLGTITSLQQLKLAAGVTSGWQCQWLVDHESLLTFLRPLQKLRFLAFYRDTYSTLGYSDADADAYYIRKHIGNNERSLASNRPELDPDLNHSGDSRDESSPDIGLWERAHRNRMLKHAEEYAAVLLALETIICGQRPMAIQAGSDDCGMRKAVPLTKDRDTCYTYLQTEFGLGTWLESVEN